MVLLPRDYQRWQHHPFMDIRCDGRHCRLNGVGPDAGGCILSVETLPSLAVASRFTADSGMDESVVTDDNAYRRFVTYYYVYRNTFFALGRLNLPDCVVGAIRFAYPAQRGCSYSGDIV